MNRKKANRWTADMFVRAWQKAKDMDDFMSSYHGTREGAAVRASQLRRAGIPLKKFGFLRVDLKRLRKIAQGGA